MNFSIWLVVGVAIGWSASFVMKTDDRPLAPFASGRRPHDQSEQLQPSRIIGFVRWRRILLAVVNLVPHRTPTRVPSSSPSRT